jgi:exonuclease III
MVKVKCPDMVFLMETKLRQKKKEEEIRTSMGFNNVFAVDCVGRSRGIALLWNNDMGIDLEEKKDMGIEIQNYSLRHINATVTPLDGREAWKFTCFYGYPEANK